MRKHFGFAGGELIGRGEVAPVGTGSHAEGPVFWEVCVGAAEVEVDPDTGFVRVRRTATAADVGRAINPQLVERQDEGATLQGLGNALFEEMVYEDGLLLNDSLLDYRIPSFEDLPDEMTCVIVENGDGPGPVRAKGCGEGALAAVPAAVVNALADAGVPMTTPPLTPERVWRRMRTEEGGYVVAVRRAAVIGTGTMGPGMAAVLARAGSDGALRRQRRGTRAREGRGRPGGLSPGRLDRAGNRVARGGSVAFSRPAEGAELVVEAVPEKLELKVEVFRQFEEAIGPRPLSRRTRPVSHDPDRDVAKHPARFVGMHGRTAAPDPDDRGLPGEQTALATSRPSDRRRVGYHASSRRRCPASSRTGSSTRSCASVCRWWSGHRHPGGLDTLRASWGIGRAAVIGPMERRHGGRRHPQRGGLIPEPGSVTRAKRCRGRSGAGRPRPPRTKTRAGIYAYTAEQVDELRGRRAGKLVAVRKALEA